MNRRGFLLGAPALVLSTGMTRGFWTPPPCIWEEGGGLNNLAFWVEFDGTGRTMLEVYDDIRDELRGLNGVWVRA